MAQHLHSRESATLPSAETLNKISLTMITLEIFRELALSFPETTEEPHFEKTSFRVKKKNLCNLR